MEHRCEYLFSVDPNESHASQCTCRATKTVVIRHRAGKIESRRLCNIHTENTNFLMTWRGRRADEVEYLQITQTG